MYTPLLLPFPGLPECVLLSSWTGAGLLVIVPVYFVFLTVRDNQVKKVSQVW